MIYADRQLPGFHLRVFAEGATFGVRFRVGRQARRMNLGPWSRGGVAAARKLAHEVIAKARLGTDVAALKREAARRRTTIGDLAPDYIAERKADLKPKTHGEMKRYLEGRQYWGTLWMLAVWPHGLIDLGWIIRD